MSGPLRSVGESTQLLACFNCRSLKVKVRDLNIQSGLTSQLKNWLLWNSVAQARLLDVGGVSVLESSALCLLTTRERG